MDMSNVKPHKAESIVNDYFLTAMVTEILGGIHIERPTDQVNNDLEKSSTFINNSFPQVNILLVFTISLS